MSPQLSTDTVSRVIDHRRLLRDSNSLFHVRRTAMCRVASWVAEKWIRRIFCWTSSWRSNTEIIIISVKRKKTKVR